MKTNPISSPPPDLRIVNIDDVLPHEKSDAQRSQPLISRLQQAEYFTNPPVVAALGNGKYVLMDGANRHSSLKYLDYDHILIQVVDYESQFIELGVWQHIVSDWQPDEFLSRLEAIRDIEIREGWDSRAVAQVLLREGPVYGLHASTDNLFKRNSTLRRVVESYHRHATLYRSPLTDPDQIWSLYPCAIALVMFPRYQPQDIIDAATKEAFLPPGVSRHIIHGRALKLNYPMRKLREESPLEEKNRELKQWLQRKLAERSVRYYAEATYQFDE
ncbi:MAG: hypothetical protein OXN94_15390 [Chloroflexota bacterium]|nr:hypothetical protein [Chloroflexota bacterium]